MPVLSFSSFVSHIRGLLKAILPNYLALELQGFESDVADLSNLAATAAAVNPYSLIVL